MKTNPSVGRATRAALTSNVKATMFQPDDSASRHKTTLVVCLLIMTLIGGLTPIGARMAVAEIPPMLAAWLRFGTAGILLWLTLRFQGRRLGFTRAEVPRLLLLAILCVPVNQLGFMGGIKLANASHAALFYALTPVLVFWGSVLARRARFSGIMFAAALLAFAGAACVLWPSIVAPGGGRKAWESMLAGDLLLLLAVGSWAAFVVASKVMLERFGALPTLAAVFLLGALVHTPVALWSARDFAAGGVTLSGVAGFLFITLISGYAGYLLTYNVLARFDATRAMIFVNVQFLITVLVERALFEVPLSAYFALGSVLICAAIALDFARLPRRGPHAASARADH